MKEEKICTTPRLLFCYPAMLSILHFLCWGGLREGGGQPKTMDPSPSIFSVLPPLPQRGRQVFTSSGELLRVGGGRKWQRPPSSFVGFPPRNAFKSSLPFWRALDGRVQQNRGGSSAHLFFLFGGLRIVMMMVMMPMSVETGT